MFKVPIIPPDLRHEETIIQAAYALDCLQNTIITIFGRIDRRIEKNNEKVKELRERINKSQAKINSLQGTRKAIRIYAPSRFPSANIFKDPPVTFNEEEKLSLKPIENYQVETKLDANLPSINEKLIFFHVRDQNSEKISMESSLAKERYKTKHNQDLGNIPSDLRSTSSVLLFNTDVSAYNLEECDNEQQSDAWKRIKQFKNKRPYSIHQSGTVKQILEPAPYSLIHRRNEMYTPSGGLKYTPKLSEAPELNLPLDLPDLPGIADDLRYDSPEAKQKIAPSLALAVENLPELRDLLKDSKKANEILTGKRDVNNITSTPPPPPPPPPMPILQLATAPPPPPLPPTKELKPAQIENRATKINPVLEADSDTRSELMAAIRNAGGVGKARLRNTAAAPLTKHDNDVVDNKSFQSTSAKKPGSMRNSSGGDLMADLHNKLLMRRKGISGSKENKNGGANIKEEVENVISIETPTGNPVISRLSALIPPPPASKHKSRNSDATSEEDSNDNDWAD